MGAGAAGATLLAILMGQEELVQNAVALDLKREPAQILHPLAEELIVLEQVHKFAMLNAVL